MEVEVVSCFFMLMIMAQAQYFMLQKDKQRIALDTDSSSPSPSRYLYQPPIPYSSLNRFTFIGISDVLWYHLTRFLIAEIHHPLPLLGLHNIRFWNCYEVTPEEAFALQLCS